MLYSDIHFTINYITFQHLQKILGYSIISAYKIPEEKKGMKESQKRTVSLIGEQAQERLTRSRVLIFGIGGVGGHLTEALARAGVGHLTLVDHDTVAESNINRQLFATRSTVGMKKVEAARARIADIDPDIIVECRDEFFLPENAASFDFSEYDCIVDCIDTVSGKIEIAVRADAAGVPVVSAMGAANKLSAQAFEISDIYKTTVCPLARVMRTELRKRGVRRLKVVYSREEAHTPLLPDLDRNGRRVPSSISYVPAAAGLVMAEAVIAELLSE